MLESLFEPGQMLEDVRLAVKGRVPVEFYARMGGVVPLPDEILREIERTAHCLDPRHKLHAREIVVGQRRVVRIRQRASDDFLLGQIRKDWERIDWFSAFPNDHFRVDIVDAHSG